MKLLFRPDPTKDEAQNRRALANRLCRVLERDKFLREEIAALLDIDPSSLTNDRPTGDRHMVDLDQYTEL